MRPRLRDCGLAIGTLPTGSLNAITDVPGIKVGHTTLIEGEGPLVPGEGPVRTGVTAVWPHAGDLFHENVSGCVHTINGFGERCGNADLISVIANLGIKYDEYDVLGDKGPEHLTELSRYVYEMVNLSSRPHQAFVGKSAFAHKGGIHVAAIRRNIDIYQHIDPELIGNSMRVLVSDLSGKGNLLSKAEEFLFGSVSNTVMHQATDCCVWVVG